MPWIWTLKFVPAAIEAESQVRTSGGSGVDRAARGRAAGGRVRDPGDARRQVVDDVDGVGRSITGVADRDIEADLGAGADRSGRVRRLDDPDVAAQDVDRRIDRCCCCRPSSRSRRRRMAVFGMTAQFWPVVGAVRVTVRVPLAATVPKLQVRTSGRDRVVGMGAVRAADRPACSRSAAVSVRVTPVAGPGPPLVTTIVKTAFWPALTVPLSGVLLDRDVRALDHDRGRVRCRIVVAWRRRSRCSRSCRSRPWRCRSETWIGPLLAPAARLANEQSRSWLPTGPVMAQPLKAERATNRGRRPPGRSSWMVTSVAGALAGVRDRDVEADRAADE